jgi:zinc protease
LAAALPSKRRQKLGRGAAALALAASLSCLGRAARDDGWPAAPPAREIRCPSGLRVVFERVRSARVASVTTLVGVGSAADPPEREGLAHLVEHLSVRADRVRDAALRVSAFGAYENADTTLDATTYYTLGPTGSVGRMMAAGARRLSAPLEGIDAAAFDVERGVVRNELRWRNETHVDGQAQSFVLSAVFPKGHPFGRPIIGTHESLSALGLEEARAWAAARYRPSSTTMVVSGDVPLEDADALVAANVPACAAAGGAPVAPVLPQSPPPPPEPPSTEFNLHKVDVATPELWLAWSVPGGQGRDRHLANLWIDILNDQFKPAQLDNRDVHGVDAFELPGADGMVLVCRVRLITGARANQAAENVLAELPWTTTDESVFWRGFEPARRAALRDLAFTREDAQSRGRDLAELAHATGELDAVRAAARVWRSITADEARDFARRYLTRARARGVYLWPTDKKAPPAADLEVARATSSMPDTVSEDVIASLAGARHIEGMRATTLDNGLTIVAVPRSGAPYVTATLALKGSAEDGAFGLPLASIYAIRIRRMEEAPDQHGINLRFWSRRGLATITARANLADLDDALAYFAKITDDYVVEWPSWQFQTYVLPPLRTDEDLPGARADAKLLEALLPGSPLGHTTSTDDLEDIQKPQIEAWFKHTLVPNNAALILIGGFDAERAVDAAGKALRGWERTGDAPTPPAAAIPAPQPKGMLFVERAGATQLEVTAGCVLPPADARRAPLYDVAARAAEDALTEVLRHELGSTYSVRSRATVYVGGTAVLRVTTALSNDAAPAGLDAFLKFWGAARAGTAPLALARARGAVASNRLFTLEAAPELANVLADRWLLGWTPASLDDDGAALLGASTEDVAATLRGCAQNLVVAVVGSEKAAREAAERALPPSATGR